MGIKTESITYICDGCKVEEVVTRDGTKDGFRPSLSEPTGWENIRTENHKYVLLCYECYQRKEGLNKTKVISFIDDCGHNCVIDVTDPRNRAQVFRDILDDAYYPEVEKTPLISEADRLLSVEGTTPLQFIAVAEKLINAVNDADLDEICSGRDGLIPFTPSTSWR